MDIRETLVEYSLEGYRRSTSSLIPNIPIDRILGVRIPVLRKLSLKLRNRVNEKEYLKALPHYHLEENNLHALMIANMETWMKPWRKSRGSYPI